MEHEIIRGIIAILRFHKTCDSGAWCIPNFGEESFDKAVEVR